MLDLKVLIIGAGLGGLTLAQSLRSQGVQVSLFERDASPWDRPQGYRLHLDADALSAAKEVLAGDLHAVFEATSQPTQPFTTILDRDLSVIKRVPTHDEYGHDVWADPDGQSRHANVDRATLRQILLTGLDEVIRYDKSLASYETSSHGVVAHFSDGSSAEGDVLVGADGIRSVVRGQRAPGRDAVDAGITAIYGRVPIDVATSHVPDETLEDIFTIASDERKVFLGLGSVRFPTPPDVAAASLAGSAKLIAQDDYVVCIVGGRHEYFANESRALRSRTSVELQGLAAEAIADWPPIAGDLIRSGDSASFFLVEMYTSVPFELDAPTNVTLVGDAIHAMTPTLGRGANVAMRDGTLLGRHLKSVASGEAALSDTLAAYERGLIDYGFTVVREAAAIGVQRMGQHPLRDEQQTGARSGRTTEPRPLRPR